MKLIFQSNIAVAYLMVIVIAIVYFPILTNDFINDKDDTLLQDLSYHYNDPLYSFVQRDYTPGAYGLFQVEYAVGTIGFFFYRVVSVLLHAANSVILFMLLLQMFRSRSFSLIVSFLFALHPVQVGTLTFVYQQQWMVSLLFLLLFLLSYLTYLRTPGKYSYAMVIICGIILLLFSGPVVYPMILLLAVHAFERKETFFSKKNLVIVSTWFAVMVVLLVVNHSRWDMVLFIDRNITLIRLGVIEGALKLIFPFTISVLKQWIWYSGHSVNYSGIIYPFLLTLITALSYSTRKQNPLIFYSWILFVLMRIPCLTSLSLPEEYGFDSMIYVSSIPFFIFILSLWNIAVQRFTDTRIKTTLQYTVPLCFIVVLTVLTYANERYWKNSEIVWTEALNESPQNVFALNRRGLYYYSHGNYSAAAIDLGAAVRIMPKDIESNMNIGMLNIEIWNLDKAIYNFQKVLETQPGNYLAYYNLGITYNEYEKYDSSIAAFTKAISYAPQFIQAYNGRGNVYGKMGNYVFALADYDRAILIDPSYSDAYGNRALTYLQIGNSMRALSDYATQARLAPKRVNVKIQYGLTALLRGDTTLATINFSFAKQLDSTMAKVYFKNYSTIFLKSPKQLQQGTMRFSAAP